MMRTLGTTHPHRSHFYPKEPFGGDTTPLERAKAVLCPDILEFKRGKALCPVHNEKTPSLQYYPRRTPRSVLDVQSHLTLLTYTEAVHSVDFKTAVAALNSLT